MGGGGGPVSHHSSKFFALRAGRHCKAQPCFRLSPFAKIPVIPKTPSIHWHVSSNVTGVCDTIQVYHAEFCTLLESRQLEDAGLFNSDDLVAARLVRRHQHAKQGVRFGALFQAHCADPDP